MGKQSPKSMIFYPLHENILDHNERYRSSSSTWMFHTWERAPTHTHTQKRTPATLSKAFPGDTINHFWLWTWVNPERFFLFLVLLIKDMFFCIHVSHYQHVSCCKYPWIMDHQGSAIEVLVYHGGIFFLFLFLHYMVTHAILPYYSPFFFPCCHYINRRHVVCIHDL